MTDRDPGFPNDDELLAAFLDPASPDPELGDDERELLTRARAALGRQEVWDGPSAGARERLLAQAAADAPSAHARPRPERSRTTWFLALGAGAAAAAVAVVLLLPSRAIGPSGTEYEIAGGAYSPGSSAEVLVENRPNGVALTLSLDDVPPAEDGTYYMGWVMNDDDPVPIGSFHNRSGEGTVVLWSGVDTDEYSTFIVTLQDEGAPLDSSDRVVLRGSITE